MTIQQLSKTVDFVQATTPAAADAQDGETFLDTSLSPPALKVFDASAGSDGAFIEPQLTQNLDEPVSTAGASQSDIESGVDSSTTGSTVSTNLDAAVSSAGATQSDIETGVDASTTGSTVSTNLDAAVSSEASGIDWSSKTYETLKVAAGENPTISGSGYVISMIPFDANNTTEVVASIRINGNFVILQLPIQQSGQAICIPLFFRFTQSFEPQENSVQSPLLVQYVLD